MGGSGGGRGFDVLEHTADIGLAVRGRTLEELFENAARGTLEILGAGARTGDREHRVQLEAEDPAGLLVRFLDELIFLVDGHGARVAGVEVRMRGPSALEAAFRWSPSREPLEGTELKGATYHQLSVRESDQGYEATVYFDV